MSAWDQEAWDRPAQAPQAAGSGRRSLRAHLAALILFALLPALAAVAIAVWRAGSAYHAASTQQLLSAAQVMARAVESELQANAEMIAALAAPAAFASDPEFPARMSLSGIATRFGGHLELRAGSAPALAAPLQALTAQAASDGRWRVSNLFEADGAFRLAIAVPYAAPAGHDVLLLTARPEHLVRALRRTDGVSTAPLVAVTDGQGRLIARSRDAERAVGRVVPDWAALQAVGAPGGVFQARTVEGGEVVFGFRTLAQTPGWVVVVGESRAMFDERWKTPVYGLAAGCALAVVLALLLAFFAARLILRPVQALARRAEYIAGTDPSGTAPQEWKTSVDEFEALRESLDRSASALRLRAETERINADMLAVSERRYRALAEAGAVVIWRRAPGGEVTAVAGWQALTGQADAAALGDGWLGQVHPDDHAEIARRWAQANAENGPVDVEFRVRTADGTWFWVRARGVPVPGAEGAAAEWIGVLEDVDQRRRAQERLAHLALHDALTGLPNRAQFVDRLHAALARARDGRCGALLLLDLDGFKDVNDRHGHPAGDLLLRIAAERLRALAGEADVIVRLGGDEFAIVRSHGGEAADDHQFAESVIGSLGARYALDGFDVTIGVSVGIAPIVHGQEDPENLVREADLALYRAKAAGRGRYAVAERPPRDAG